MKLVFPTLILPLVLIFQKGDNFTINNLLFLTGHCAHPDDIIIDGDLQALSFSAYFCEGEFVRAVVSTSNVTAAFAEYLSAGNTLTKAEVQADPTQWRVQVAKGKI